MKIGDRVTLVGDSHRDGTFTADTVVLCNATQGIANQENGTVQTVWHVSANLPCDPLLYV